MRISFMQRRGVWKKRSDVAVRAPMPSAIKSKTGDCAPSKRKLWRISDSYFAAAFFGIKFPTNPKYLLVLERDLREQRFP